MYVCIHLRSSLLSARSSCRSTLSFLVLQLGHLSRSSDNSVTRDMRELQYRRHVREIPQQLCQRVDEVHCRLQTCHAVVDRIPLEAHNTREAESLA